MKRNCAGIKNATFAAGEVISMCVVPVRLSKTLQLTEGSKNF